MTMVLVFTKKEKNGFIHRYLAWNVGTRAAPDEGAASEPLVLLNRENKYG